MERLRKNHSPGKMYILKKNIQRQTGLKLTDDLDEIEKNKDGYVIAQDLLLNSYLVNKRKINLRVYIIVVCYKDTTDIYMFNNGFMYYTKKEFDLDDTSEDNHITTGYIERDVYTKNPLTHQDFKKYLDMKEGDKYHSSNSPRQLYSYEKDMREQNLLVSKTVFKRIERLISDVFISFKGSVCRKVDDNKKPIHIYNNYSIQIFGADVAINDQLQPQIIEINKGPDLSAKDELDGEVKKKLVSDTLEIIGVTPYKKSNGLIKILSM